MPIFAYRCDHCGFEKDVLQKRSDPALERCPSCGLDSFRKQVSAPAFQLKGSGWYVTDFRDKGKEKSTGAKGAQSSPASAGSAEPAPAAAPKAPATAAEPSGGAKPA